MNLREELLVDNSKAQAEKIADWAISNSKKLSELMQTFLYDEYRVVQRAAHAIDKIVDTKPQILQPYYEVMVKRLQNDDIPDAVKRNVLRTFQNVEIPEPLHGELMNICFDLLTDLNQPIAIHVFAMTVLDNLSNHYPEIKQELNLILTERLQQKASAGFRSRAKKILNWK